MALTLDFKSVATVEAVCQAIRESTRQGPHVDKSERFKSSFHVNAFEVRYAEAGTEDPKPFMRGRVAPRDEHGSTVFVEISYGWKAPAAVAALLLFMFLFIAYDWGSPFGWLFLAGPPAIVIFYVHRERNITVDDRDVHRLTEIVERAVKAADAARIASLAGMTRRDRPK